MSATVQLDDMLEVEQAEAWLKIKRRALMPKTRGHNPKIPAFWINEQTVRFHPRTIIAKMAHDAGIPAEIIAASFGIYKQENK